MKVSVLILIDCCRICEVWVKLMGVGNCGNELRTSRPGTPTATSAAGDWRTINPELRPCRGVVLVGGLSTRRISGYQTTSTIVDVKVQEVGGGSVVSTKKTANAWMVIPLPVVVDPRFRIVPSAGEDELAQRVEGSLRIVGPPVAGGDSRSSRS